MPVFLRSAGCFILLLLGGCGGPREPSTWARVDYQSLPPGVKGERQVFYATDRQVSGDETYLNDASDSEELRYGSAIISIPEVHHIGELERPWQILNISFPEDARRHIMLVKQTGLGRDSFYDSVKRSIDLAPERSAFVFVHGYNVSFRDALLRTGQLAWDLKFRGPAITYSWPSAGATGKYVADADMALWTAPHLAFFLQRLRAQTGVRTIHVIGHSMGTQALALAFERLARAQPPVHFQEIVLAAPDINLRLFRQLSFALHSDSDRVTIYASDRDRALGASTLLRGVRGQVRAGADPKLLSQIAGFDVIDASRARASLLNHSYFAEDTLLLNDLALLLKQRLTPDQRSITLEAQGPIWVLRP